MATIRTCVLLLFSLVATSTAIAILQCPSGKQLVTSPPSPNEWVHYDIDIGADACSFVMELAAADGYLSFQNMQLSGNVKMLLYDGESISDSMVINDCNGATDDYCSARQVGGRVAQLFIQRIDKAAEGNISFDAARLTYPLFDYRRCACPEDNVVQLGTVPFTWKYGGDDTCFGLTCEFHFESEVDKVVSVQRTDIKFYGASSVSLVNGDAHGNEMTLVDCAQDCREVLPEGLAFQGRSHRLTIVFSTQHHVEIVPFIRPLTLTLNITADSASCGGTVDVARFPVGQVISPDLFTTSDCTYKYFIDATDSNLTFMNNCCGFDSDEVEVTLFDSEANMANDTRLSTLNCSSVSSVESPTNHLFVRVVRSNSSLTFDNNVNYTVRIMGPDGIVGTTAAPVDDDKGASVVAGSVGLYFLVALITSFAQYFS